MRNRWLLIGLGLILLVASLGLEGEEQRLMAATAPLRLGEINPLSGNLALHGTEIHQGIVAAVEEVNAAGGIQGRRVELISRDDQSRPEVALNQAQDLVHREKVVSLVGGYVDSLVAPISELAARYQVPYVASASLLRALTQGRENPFFFRVSRLDGITEPLCRFVASQIKPRAVGIIYVATPGSSEFAAAVKKNLEGQGIRVRLMEKVRPGSPDFSIFLLKARQAQIDLLISGGFYPDNLILTRQLKEQNLPLKAFIGPWGVAYENFIREVGAAGEGLVGTCAWSPGITQPGTEAAAEKFVADFVKRFGSPPNSTTMHGYSSARALLAALNQVLSSGQEVSGPAVAQALRQLDLQLPMGRLQFDAKGDPQHYTQVLVQIQQGRLVPIFPPERSAGAWRPLAP